MTDLPSKPAKGVVALVCVHNCTSDNCGKRSLWLVPEKIPPLNYYKDVIVDGTKIVGPADPDVVSEILTNLRTVLHRLGYKVEADETADD